MDIFLSADLACLMSQNRLNKNYLHLGGFQDRQRKKAPNTFSSSKGLQSRNYIDSAVFKLPRKNGQFKFKLFTSIHRRANKLTFAREAWDMHCVDVLSELENGTDLCK